MFGQVRLGPYVTSQLVQNGPQVIEPLPKGMAFRVPSPADSLIQPSAGDDLSPPNSLRAGKLNAICTHAIANVGFSTSDRQDGLAPSHVRYDIKVKHAGGLNRVAMDLQLTLEYTNPNAGESMVVWMKKCKQFLCDEHEPDQELVLVNTRFQDFVEDAPSGAEWLDITTDIRYSEEAEAVVQAVIQSNLGQTAGRLKTFGGVEDAKLGPVGPKGRILLTYSCKSMYTYAQMSMTDDAPGRVLAPLVLWLPHALLHDHKGSRMTVAVDVDAPEGAGYLDPHQPCNRPAIDHLRTVQEFSDALVLLPKATERLGPFHWPCLPPVPWCMLFWLSLPTPECDVSVAADTGSVVQVHVPPADLSPYMSVSAPGNGLALGLLRATVQTHATRVPEGSVRVLTNIVISDASGSTAMQCQGQAMRSHFNALAVRRFLKRLESVPQLLQSGVLSGRELWVEVMYVFDHAVRAEFQCMFEVQTLACGDIVKAIVSAAAADDTATARSTAAQEITRLCSVSEIGEREEKKRQRLCTGILDFVSNIRGITPGGATSFVAPAQRAVQAQPEFAKAVAEKLGSQTPLYTAYANWDTDGGNNCGSCYEALSALADQCHVRGGFVTGFGSWVDQDCATRVAQILGGPCMLCLEVPAPGSEGMSAIFRQDFNGWIKALRSVPVPVAVSGGSVSWQTPRGLRRENAVDLVVLKPQTPSRDAPSGLKFGLPDVAATDHTGACVEGVTGGRAYTAYLMSRVPANQLAQQLAVVVGGAQARVDLVQEKEDGVLLAHDWMSVLQGTAAQVTNKALLTAPLRQRMMDDLSFIWNLPTPTGSTACLGRQKTARRPPVSPRQQPQEPVLQLPTTSPGPETQCLRFLRQQQQHEQRTFVSSFSFGAGASTQSVSSACRPQVPVLSPGPQAVSFSFGSSAPAPQAQAASFSFGSGAPALQKHAVSGLCWTGAPALQAAGLPSGASASAPSGARVPLGSAPVSCPSSTVLGKRCRIDMEADVPAVASGQESFTIATPRLILAHSRNLRLPCDGNTDEGSPTELLMGSLRCLKPKMDLLQGTVTAWTCDVCGIQIPRHSTRFHCSMCIAFDMCESCFGSGIASEHSTEHHIVPVPVSEGPPPPAVPAAEDPLTAAVLGPAPPTSPSPGAADETLVDAKARLRRFVEVLRFWKVVLEPLLQDAGRWDVYAQLDAVLTVCAK